MRARGDSCLRFTANKQASSDSRLAARHCARAVIAAAACIAPLAHAAQTVNDPTLPPPQLRAHAGAARTTTHVTNEPPRVALILRSGNRRSAVVDGRGVQEGDMLAIGGTRWRVDRIDDDGVWLAEGAKRRRLELFSATGRAVQRREKQ